MRPFAAVILAAGASTRMGRPKQLIEVDGKSLVERAVQVALEAGAGPVVVVLGAHAEQISAKIKGLPALAVVNHRWQEGMGSSIALGVKSLRLETEAVLILHCDHHGVTPQHLKTLASTPGRIVASEYEGVKGVPALFDRSHFAALTALSGDYGARDLIRRKDAVAVELKGHFDLDTPEDLARLASHDE